MSLNLLYVTRTLTITSIIDRLYIQPTSFNFQFSRKFLFLIYHCTRRAVTTYRIQSYDHPGHCRHFTISFQKISENIEWKDTLFYKNKCWKTYYIFFLITFWAGQSASRKQHFLEENIHNVFRTCFCRKRVSLISMFVEKTWWNASSGRPSAILRRLSVAPHLARRWWWSIGKSFIALAHLAEFPETFPQMLMNCNTGSGTGKSSTSTPCEYW